MKFDAVTFDVDGTLYDFRELAKVFGATALLRRRFLKAYMEAREEVRQTGEICDVRLKQSEGVARRMGCSVEEAVSLTERYIEGGWEKFHRVRPVRGVRELLDALASAGVKLGLISDYPASAKIQGLGLHDLPWVTEIAAEPMGALKPHASVYEAALEALDLEASRVLHVGDRLDADVGGAKAVGMAAALFTAGNSREWPGIGYEPDFVFERYEQLADWLES